MNDIDRRIAVKNFVAQWTGRGYEKGEAQPFWLALLRDVFNIAAPEKVISFEVPVVHGFIDGLIVETRTLIEQKSSAVNLDDPEIFRQAKRYNDALEFSRKARWIITCNFAEFRVYDMDKRRPELDPTKILLTELAEKFHALDFLVDATKNKLHLERELSIKAGAIVAKIYTALREQLHVKTPDTLSDLNKLCVRLVFCLYAESIDIFGKHKIFRDWLAAARNIRTDLLELFTVLDTPPDKRSPYLDETLQKFPYVDGGLFKDTIDFPNFTPEVKELLLDEASSNFDWSQISPAIFGTVFESTLEDDTRRAGGMHYTSTANIHKVIDPLFLDDLRAEFETARRATRNRRKILLALQDKIAALKFFDPACGSGNFLTETFLCLRRLENDILKELLGVQIQLGELDNPIKVSIAQFAGIELNNFAVTVAQTALWIAELTMKRETEQIVRKSLELFPLKSYAGIHEANALQIDWRSICAGGVDYIISNPPFVGKSFQTSAQKSDMANVFASISGYGNLDYVACWFKKAADFIHNTKTACAFVATNSIGQGIAVPPLWTYLFGRGVVINFVHQTFKWTSESADIAAVHCVIVGFANFHASTKKIFDGQSVRVVENINAYLLDAPNVIVLPQANPLRQEVPPMIVGSCPTDGGNFLLTAEEREDFIKREPAAEKWIRRYVGSNEFINNIMRYCLWLKDCPPNILRKMPLVMKRVEGVHDFRLASKKAQTRRRADTPTLFAEDRFVDAPAIIIPMLSSSNRRYVPIGFVDAGVIVNIQASFIPNGDLYIFGVLNSSIMMTWLKTVGGQFKSDYRFSATTVYNTFPWCEPSDKQRRAIEDAAQKILDVREKYSGATLADLYDELSMPKDLRDAHRDNDRAVAAVYGFGEILDEEPTIVAALLKLYQKLSR